MSLSAPLGMAITSRFSGSAMDYWGEKRLMLCGLAILLAALILLTLRHPNWGILSFVILLFIYGLGCGIFVPPNISHIMQSAGSEHQGTMGAINRMFFNLGNGIGVVTAAFIIAINTEQTTAKIIAGLRWAWFAAAAVMAIALISAIWEQFRQQY
ncbi:MAG: MFS transporter [Gammaproteobacteria bacterium]|nr:MFS transporter [Gammaproteobacteria bacterium]